MSNKEIQEKRMKAYFLEATRELLKGEGLQAVNVRSVAEKAGYSFATMYNYFRDINDLVFKCVEDFRQECSGYVETKVPKGVSGARSISIKAKAYIDYFVQYPGIFELFYIEKIRETESSRTIAALISQSLSDICSEDWKYCTGEKRFTEQEATGLARGLEYLVAGALLFYLNRRQPADYREFIATTSEQIDRWLGIEKS